MTMVIMFLALQFTMPSRKKGLEDSVIPNDEDINYKIIIIYYDESLASDIDHPQTKFWILKE